MDLHRKVGRPSKRAEKMPEIKILVEDGWSRSEIAEKLGLTLPTLCRWLEQEGIEMKRIDRNPDRSANFGNTHEERVETGRQGGLASSRALYTVKCTYEPCGKEFARERSTEGRQRLSRDRFCSKEHAYAHRRETSGKTTKYTCDACGKEFSGWTNNRRRFCSRRCYHEGRQQIPRYGFEGRILDSGYEAAFIGLCSLRGIQYEFFDRALVVNGYGPDFVVYVGGQLVYVDTKGLVRNDHGWMPFREERGLLAIVDRNDLDRLFQLPTKTRVLNAILHLAQSQAA